MTKARKVLIAGAGIGGLTAAACLLQRGIDVDVFEQAPSLGEVGAGIQVSANAGRVYRHIGLLDSLIEEGCTPSLYRFRLHDTGEVLQTIPLGDSYIERHGVPYITVHRADLHRLLVDRVLALKADAILLGAKATGFEEGASGVELQLDNGKTYFGDALVGADGIRSAIRSQIIGLTPTRFTGDASWRVIVPMDRLAPEHQLQSVDIWVGPGRHTMTYPLRKNTLLNFVGCVEKPHWNESSWVARQPWKDMESDFPDWHPSVRAIIDGADHDDCYCWAMNDRIPVHHWSTQRATLLGDAAHPTLPYMAQGAAMAVEDAAVVARALERFNVTEALERYRLHRSSRTERIVNESYANRQLFHQPSHQALRDAFAKRDMNAERTAWLFSYDPTTAELA
jgi:salicylate hydroxylase